MYGVLDKDRWKKAGHTYLYQRMAVLLWTDDGVYLRLPLGREQRYHYYSFQEETIEGRIKEVLHCYQLERQFLYIVLGDERVQVKTMTLPFKTEKEVLSYIEEKESPDYVYGVGLGIEWELGRKEWTVLFYPKREAVALYKACRSYGCYVWKLDTLAHRIAQKYNYTEGKCTVYQQKSRQEIVVGQGTVWEIGHHCQGEAKWKVELLGQWSEEIKSLMPG